MKSLFVGIVVAALIATIVADIEEYSEDVVERINTKLDLLEVKEAQLINSNTRLQFHLRREEQPDAIYLETTAVVEQALQEEDSVCEHWIGVKLDKGQQYFCNITDFGVEVDYGFLRDDVHNMQLVVVLHSSSTPQILLDIPILRIPSWVHPDNVTTWARQNQVGFIPPVSVEQLQQFHGTQQLSFDFTWLRDLLQYGLKESDHRRQTEDGSSWVDFYVPRPLVLSDDIINKLWEEVDWYKLDEGSEDTDELSELDGLASRNLP